VGGWVGSAGASGRAMPKPTRPLLVKPKAASRRCGPIDRPRVDPTLRDVPGCMLLSVREVMVAGRRMGSLGAGAAAPTFAAAAGAGAADAMAAVETCKMGPKGKVSFWGVVRRTAEHWALERGDAATPKRRWRRARARRRVPPGLTSHRRQWPQARVEAQPSCVPYGAMCGTGRIIEDLTHACASCSTQRYANTAVSADINSGGSRCLTTI
jgi:hypothetical protein